MTLILITPAGAGSLSGNRVTALRWARLLRQLGHRVRVSQRFDGRRTDAMIALHARKSFEAIRRFHTDHPERPLIVALGGTDLYHDLRTSARARVALEWADRIVVLQPLAASALPRRLRSRTRAIIQSARRARQPVRAPRGEFRVCVLSHLRPIKDPLRAALATRLLPPDSRVRVVHAGRALSRSIEVRARREARRNPRYVWLGATSHARALRILAGSSLLVLPSLLEGGANVISEALAAGVPVLASRVPGSVGLLGARYPGYFRPGDTRGLGRLLRRCETEPRFLDRLRVQCARLSPRVRPAAERSSWRRLLGEVARPPRR